jgi:hypothetical protein
MWIQQDGASPHCSREMRQQLSENYPERWISSGRCSSLASTLAKLESSRIFSFSMWMFGNQVCASTEELWRRIQQFASEIKDTSGIFYRL